MIEAFGASKEDLSSKYSDNPQFVQPFKIIPKKPARPSPLAGEDAKVKSKSVMATAHTIASLNALANIAR